jgi:PHD/YefM family antitoxin component YafN of YafNO toxin-antitoxin module
VKLITSRAFNQDVSQAKRLAREEPVFVTDRGRPTHVLLDIASFRRMAGDTNTILDALAMDEPVGHEPDWPALRRRGR